MLHNLFNCSTTSLVVHSPHSFFLHLKVCLRTPMKNGTKPWFTTHWIWCWWPALISDIVCTFASTFGHHDTGDEAKYNLQTSLTVQWIRNCLPIQGTQVWSLAWEDPTCVRAIKLVHYNYWAHALEPASHNYWTCVLQLLKPRYLQLMLCHKRSHYNEKLVHRN